MNKHKFIELVEAPSGIRHKDADILTELARNYPYSSLVRTMLAKARQGTPQAKENLSTAALYIPDRKVLKAIMEDKLPLRSARPTPETNNTSQQTEREQQDQQASQESPVKMADKADPEEAPQAAAAPINIIDELQENLRKLREQRIELNNPTHKSDELLSEEEKKDSSPIEIPIKQLPERLQEIIFNREEQQIRDPKRLEQINMIDSFIQNSSNIARKYRSLGDDNQEQNDLSSGHHFTPPALVTENLAQIMVRQGKTEKAIDIYEQLVLKYPQKKAYFATCIEKLKTSL